MNQVLISDFDGTLTDGEIERDFVNYLRKTGKLRFYQYVLSGVSIPVNCLRRIFWRGNLLKAWRAVPLKVNVSAWINDYIENDCMIRLNGEVCRYIDAFSGRKILLTGSSTELAAAYLESRGCANMFDEIIGCEVFGCGYFVKSHPYGKDKVKRIKETDGMRTGLGNEYADRFFLRYCERAVAVAPDPELRAYAGKEGWEIIS